MLTKFLISHAFMSSAGGRHIAREMTCHQRGLEVNRLGWIEFAKDTNKKVTIGHEYCGNMALT